MDGLNLRINDILAAWNPLAVPADLASCEYSSYVPEIAAALMDRRPIKPILLQILDEIGMDKPYGSDVMEDIDDMSRRISVLVNDRFCQK